MFPGLITPTVPFKILHTGPLNAAAGGLSCDQQRDGGSLENTTDWMKHGAVFSISDHHRGVDGGGGGGKKKNNNPQGNTVYSMLVTQEGVSAWREVNSLQNWGYNRSIPYVTAHQRSCRGLVFTSPPVARLRRPEPTALNESASRLTC